MKVNELYFVISKTWWSSWIQYINNNNKKSVFKVDRPGRITNELLMEKDQRRLRSDLTEKKEYIIITEALWMTLVSWYGGGPTISRRVICTSENKLELELYPLLLRISICMEDGIPGEPKDQLLCSKVQTVKKVKKRICQIYNFKQSDCRLWVIDSTQDDELLENEDVTLEYLEFCEETLIMVEKKSDNGKWVYCEHTNHRQRDDGPPGMVGLENLGNTCYMNSALQCLLHAPVFKDYFLSNAYIDHINTESKSGLYGEFANVFGTLLCAVWKNSHSVIAPRMFKKSIVELNSEFQGFTQHDAQEFLTCVLDVSECC